MMMEVMEEEVWYCRKKERAGYAYVLLAGPGVTTSKN